MSDEDEDVSTQEDQCDAEGEKDEDKWEQEEVAIGRNTADVDTPDGAQLSTSEHIWTIWSLRSGMGRILV